MISPLVRSRFRGAALSAVLIAPSVLGAQPVYDALDIANSDITITATAWAITQSGTYDGVDALSYTFPTKSDITTLLIDPAYDGWLRFQFFVQGDQYIVPSWMVYEEPYFREIEWAPYEFNKWTEVSFFVRQGTTYKFECGGFFEISGMTIVIDAMELIPVGEGDLTAALDSNLHFENTSLGLWVATSEDSYLGSSSAVTLPEVQGALLESVVEGPVTLTFAARSAESSSSFPLEVTVNGESAGVFYGTEWAVHTLTLGGGQHVVNWKGMGAGAGVYYLDAVQATPLEVGDLSEAADIDSVFTASGGGVWYSQSGFTSDGIDALRGVPAGRTDAVLSMKAAFAPAFLNFRTARDSASAELTVKVGLGNAQKLPNGEPGQWTIQRIAVLHPWDTVTWRAKGGFAASSYIDQVSIEPIVIGNLSEAGDTNLLLVDDADPFGGVWRAQSEVSHDGEDALEALDYPGSYATLSAVVEGPCDVSFYGMAADTPANLLVTVDDDVWVYNSHSTEWNRTQFSVPTGVHTIRWKATSGYGHSYYIDRIRVYPGGGYPFSQSEASGDWMKSPWYGWYWDGRYPWLYSTSNDWQYVSGVTGSNLWLWDMRLGEWLWTAENSYPFVYSATLKEWFYLFRNGGPSMRVFYQLSTGTYLSEEQLTALLRQ